jgi:hypothetical protein
MLSTLKQGDELPARANLPERTEGRSRNQAASAVNVSPRSVESAAKELRKFAEFPRRLRAPASPRAGDAPEGVHLPIPGARSPV